MWLPEGRALQGEGTAGSNPGELEKQQEGQCGWPRVRGPQQEMSSERKQSRPVRQYWSLQELRFSFWVRWKATGSFQQSDGHFNRITDRRGQGLKQKNQSGGCCSNPGEKSGEGEDSLLMDGLWVWQKRSKGDSKVLVLSNWKDEFLVNRVGNPLEEQGVGKIKSSVLYLLNLTCRGDSQMEVLSSLQDLWVWNPQERAGLEILTGSHPRYKWPLEPQDWVWSLWGEGREI